MHVLAEHQGCTEEHMPKVAWQYGPSAERFIQKQPRANITQYYPERVHDMA